MPRSNDSRTRRLTPADGHTTWSAEFHLRPDVFPIRRYAQFEDLLNRNISDPLTAIFAALAPNRHATARVDITIRPAAKRRMKQARKLLRKLASPFFRRILLSPAPMPCPPRTRGP